MKHRFLLDVNILYFGVKGVDENGRPDSTCSELTARILANCHTIRVDDALLERYKEHMDWLRGDPRSMPQPLGVLNSLLHRSDKTILEAGDSPPLPQGIQVPKKDEYVVRAALHSRPAVVTCDHALKRAINEQSAALGGLKAITPAEALELAKDK